MPLRQKVARGGGAAAHAWGVGWRCRLPHRPCARGAGCGRWRRLGPAEASAPARVTGKKAAQLAGPAGRRPNRMLPLPGRCAGADLKRLDHSRRLRRRLASGHTPLAGEGPTGPDPRTRRGCQTVAWRAGPGTAGPRHRGCASPAGGASGKRTRTAGSELTRTLNAPGPGVSNLRRPDHHESRSRPGGRSMSLSLRTAWPGVMMHLNFGRISRRHR